MGANRPSSDGELEPVHRQPQASESEVIAVGVNGCEARRGRA